MSKKSAALARVRQLACLGLPGGLFVASVLPILRALTESDSAAFFWLDESGAIANFYAERFPISLSAAAALAPAEGERSEPPFKPVSVAVLASTIDDETDGRGWYHEVLRRNGAHFILHGVARLDGVVLGRVTLFRAAMARAYGVAEVVALSSVIRYVAHGLLPHDAEVEDDGEDVFEEELVVADGEGRVVHATEKGRRLLLLATGRALTPTTLPAVGSESHRLLRAICAQGEGGRAGLARNTIWGRFLLRAYPLGDEAQPALIGVHIRRTQPAMLRFVNAMSALPLSPQQREIALLIAKGATNRDIAARLSVSVNTVAYHIKQLFYKLQVHDRGELLAKIKIDPLRAAEPKDLHVRRPLPLHQRPVPEGRRAPRAGGLQSGD